MYLKDKRTKSKINRNVLWKIKKTRAGFIHIRGLIHLYDTMKRNRLWGRESHSKVLRCVQAAKTVLLYLDIKGKQDWKSDVLMRQRGIFLTGHHFGLLFRTDITLKAIKPRIIIISCLDIQMSLNCKEDIKKRIPIRTVSLVICKREDFSEC